MLKLSTRLDILSIVKDPIVFIVGNISGLSKVHHNSEVTVDGGATVYTGMSLGKKKLHFFRDAQSFPAGGLEGCCKPPSGVRGRAPEANAYWQQSTENCCIII